jgi:hypothetical protein
MPTLPSANFTHATTTVFSTQNCGSKLTTAYMATDKCVNDGTSSSRVVCDKVNGMATTTSYTSRNCAGGANPTQYNTNTCINVFTLSASITCNSGSSIVAIWGFILLSLIYTLFN